MLLCLIYSVTPVFPKASLCKTWAPPYSRAGLGDGLTIRPWRLTHPTHSNSLIHTHTPGRHSHYKIMRHDKPLCKTEFTATEETEMIRWLGRWCPDSCPRAHRNLQSSSDLTAWPEHGCSFQRAGKSQKSLCPVSCWPQLLKRQQKGQGWDTQHESMQGHN